MFKKILIGLAVVIVVFLVVVALQPADFRTLRHAKSVALDRLKGWVTGAGQRILHGR